MVMHQSRASTVEIVPDSGSVISHAGALVWQGLCDKIGLTDAITAVFGVRGPQTIARGSVMRDLAVTIADGGDAVIAVEALRSQNAAFGPVASDTTVWRMLEELDEDRRHEFRRVLGAARDQVWADARVALRLCRLLAVDVDATLVGAHTDKELAAGTYKKGYGFHPVVCSLDCTREPLAILQRAGFEAYGEEFEECGILHRHMRIAIPAWEPRHASPIPAHDENLLTASNRETTRAAVAALAARHAHLEQPGGGRQPRVRVPARWRLRDVCAPVRCATPPK